LWSSNEIDWVKIGAINTARGIITMWRRNSFNLTSSFNGRFFLVVECVWKVGLGVQVMIVNGYSSGSLKDRKKVWDEIYEIRKSQQSKVWCVVGNFNSIIWKEKRKNVVSVSDYSREIAKFNEFIENSELMDISMVGRKFTWSKPNGSTKSKIDRILVS